MTTALSQSGRTLLRDTAWNAAVNAATAGLSVFLLMLTVRFAGAYWGGVVALGLAMSQQLFTLGNFTMESYHASDIAEKRSFADYVAAKSLTLGAMLLAGAAWLAAGHFGRDKSFAFVGLLAYQASDAFSNAFFARYQLKGRLDVGCRVRLDKIAAFAGVYAGMLWATDNPVAALWTGSAVHAALFFALDVPKLRVFGPLRGWGGWRASASVLAACAPLALNSFLVMYVSNGPRFAVDGTMGEESLAKFSALFMVSFAVAVCGDFLMNPQIVRLAAAVQGRDRGGAWRIVGRQAVLIAGLGAAGLAVAATVGIPVLSWVFGLDLSGYRGVLLALLGGGVLVAYYQLAQFVLVVLRRQIWATPGMVVAAAFVFFAARPCVARAGLAGAAVAYDLAVAFLALGATAFAARFFRAAFQPTHAEKHP